MLHGNHSAYCLARSHTKKETNNKTFATAAPAVRTLPEVETEPPGEVVVAVLVFAWLHELLSRDAVAPLPAAATATSAKTESLSVAVVSSFAVVITVKTLASSAGGIVTDTEGDMLRLAAVWTCAAMAVSSAAAALAAFATIASVVLMVDDTVVSTLSSLRHMLKRRLVDAVTITALSGTLQTAAIAVFASASVMAFEAENLYVAVIVNLTAATSISESSNPVVLAISIRSFVLLNFEASASLSCSSNVVIFVVAAMLLEAVLEVELLEIELLEVRLLEVELLEVELLEVGLLEVGLLEIGPLDVEVELQGPMAQRSTSNGTSFDGAAVELLGLIVKSLLVEAGGALVVVSLLVAEILGPLLVTLTASNSMLSLPAPSPSKEITTLGTLLDNLRACPSANLRPFSLSNSVVVLHSKLSDDPLTAHVLDSHQGVAPSSSDVLVSVSTAKSSLLKSRTLAHVLVSGMAGCPPPNEADKDMFRLLLRMVRTRELVPVLTIEVTRVSTFKVVVFI